MAPTGPCDGPKIIEGMFTFEVDLYKPLGARLGIDVMLFRSQTGSSLIVESVNEGGIVEAWNQQSQEPIRIRSGDFIVKVNGVEGNMSALSGVLRTGREFRITVQRVAQAGFGQGAFGCATADEPLALSAQPQSMAATPQALVPRTALTASPAPSPTGISAVLPRGNPPVLDGDTGDVGPDTANITDASEQFTCEVMLFRREGAKLGIDVLPFNMGETSGLSVKRILTGGVVDEWNQSSRKNFNICPGDCIIRVNDVMADLAQMMEELRTQHELRLAVVRRGAASTSVDAPPGPGPTNLAVNTTGRPREMPSPPQGGGTNGPGGSIHNWGSMPGLPEPSIGNWDLGLGVGAGSAPAVDDANIPGQGPGTAYTANGGRLLRFDVELERKPCMRLGLDVMLVKGNGLCDLVVERVASGGCVDQWNQWSRPPHCVQPGDCIVQVNGIGNWQNLSRIADAFSRDPHQVRFTVQRGNEPMIATPVPGPMGQNWKTAANSMTVEMPGPMGQNRKAAANSMTVEVPGPMGQNWKAAANSMTVEMPGPMGQNWKRPPFTAAAPVAAVPPSASTPMPPWITTPTGLGSPSFPKEPHISTAKAPLMLCQPSVYELPEPPPTAPMGLPPMPQASLTSSTKARDAYGIVGSTISNSIGIDAEEFSMH